MNALPDVLEYQGRRFLRARLEKPYVGVVAQYREAKETDAGHLFVYADGRHVLAHVDSHNPDAGPLHALAHFFLDDHNTRQIVFVFGGVGFFLGWLIGRQRRV